MSGSDTIDNSVRLVSEGPNGIGNKGSYGAVLSPDGQKVVFGSASTNLTAARSNGGVFVKDLTTGQLTLVSIGDLGDANSTSSPGSISADGTKIVFNSFASNLVTGDTNATSDVFLKDLATGSVMLISAGVAGIGDGYSSGGMISADGAKVAFDSLATNLAPGDTNGKADVFVRDLASGTITLVSDGAAGPANGSSSQASISADGSKVAFRTAASNLAPGDTNGEDDIYVKDLATGAVTRASGDPGGVAPGSASFAPSLSADGSKVAYSVVVALGGAQQNLENIYVADLNIGTVTLVSTGPAGIGNSLSNHASISADGRKVAFESNSSNFDPNATTNFSNVYVKDLASGTLTLVTMGVDGQANSGSFHPSLSGDGSVVAFESSASNLIPADFNQQSDVFVQTVGGPPLPGSRTIGSGTDTLVLKVSQDAYQGSAIYTVSVDGKQVNGVLTAAALHSLGQDDTITVKGAFGPGSHTPSVNFLNDAYGGSPAADRNLYVDAVTYDGVAQPEGGLSLFTPGTQSSTFSVPKGAATTIGAGQDSVTLKVSEDAYQGDAQFTVSLDGQQFGGIFTATALHGTGYYDYVTIKGTYGYSARTLTVNFLNDAYGGSPAADRNLYVEGIETTSAGAVPDAQAALDTAGPRDFGLPGPADPNVKIWLGGNAGDSLYDPLNWTPSGVPQATDRLFIPMGTVNVDGGDANGARILLQSYVLPGRSPSSSLSTATFNLVSARVDVMDQGSAGYPVLTSPIPDGPTINAFGSSSLSAVFSGDRIFGAANATINITANATLSLVGNGLNQNYSRVSINAAAGATLENDSKVTLQSNSTLTINADTIGIGSFAPGYATRLEFAGMVGSGQTLVIDSTSPSTIDIDHPDTFEALIDWSANSRSGLSTVDLRGLMGDSFAYDNNVLTLYSGDKVVDTARLTIRPSTEPGTPYATLHVAQGTDGVLLTLTNASAALGLPMHT